MKKLLIQILITKHDINGNSRKIVQLINPSNGKSLFKIMDYWTDFQAALKFPYLTCSPYQHAAAVDKKCYACFDFELNRMNKKPKFVLTHIGSISITPREYHLILKCIEPITEQTAKNFLKKG